MNLFNKKILAQHIARFDFPREAKLDQIQKIIQGWQKALKNSDLNKTKETGIQGQFLSKFFENILGYDTQTSGKEQWHLIQEPKTDVDSQEADGALGFFIKGSQQVKAVIELKDARTSLDKKQQGRVGKLTPVEQAFNYLNKFDGCQWVIVSNFHEIRLYSKFRGQGFYEKFDITELDQEQQFKQFYYLLNKNNLIDDGLESVIEQLVKETNVQEENITKQFYAQYKDIRLKLLQHLFQNNPEISRLVLVEKTQKILDRLIFTMVCEDSSTLLPAHIIKNTYERAFQSFALSDSDQRVWSEFKGLFHAIDKGNKRVNPPINAYNGGLFKLDEVLDSLIIKDEIWEVLITLTHYDFESDLNVNVLGHIFEQSISDLEEIRESVILTTEDGNDLITENGDKIVLDQSNSSLVEKKGKRKKMGIFYTPEYITKFIIENTVGRYLEENPDKLETIKIVDPACGSGAFLNQSHSYLLNEYKLRTEQKQLEKHRKGESLTLWDTNLAENDKSILLNNLYGVDLSPESVEITKLALWLKTAKATEPLQNLDQNIKCGNSLVDDPDYANEQAFNWKEEFKEIMDQGGFDVVVGNPPYVRQELIREIKPYLEMNYSVYSGVSDLYVYFFERGLSLLKEGGYFAFIVSNKFLRADYGRKLTQYLQKNYKILEIIDFGDIQIFDGATTYPCIITLQNKKPEDQQFVRLLKLKSVDNAIDLEQESKKTGEVITIHKDDENWQLRGNELDSLLRKIKLNRKTVKEYLGNIIYRGIITGFNEGFIVDGSIKDKLCKEDRNSEQVLWPLLIGKDINRYSHKKQSLWLISIPSGWTNLNRGEIGPETYFKTRYPAIHKYLLDVYDKVSNESKLRGKGLYDRDDKGDYWWELRPCAYYSSFREPKIMWGNLATQASFDYDEGKNYLSAPACFIPTREKWLLAILNSKISTFFLKNTAIERQGGFIEQKPMYVEQIPLPEVDTEIISSLTSLVDKLTLLRSEFNETHEKTYRFLVEDFSLTKSTNKLNKIINLGWNELVSILEANKVFLQIEKKEKLMAWLKERQKILTDLDVRIGGMNANIDQHVYSLYGLGQKEIQVIETYLTLR